MGVLLRSEWARSISRSSFSAIKSCRFEIGFDRFAGFFHGEAAVFLRNVFVERAVGVEDVDRADFGVPLPHFVVVWIVRRRDLHAAGAELGFGPLVGDEGDCRGR